MDKFDKLFALSKELVDLSAGLRAVGPPARLQGTPMHNAVIAKCNEVVDLIVDDFVVTPHTVEHLMSELDWSGIDFDATVRQKVTAIASERGWDDAQLGVTMLRALICIHHVPFNTDLVPGFDRLRTLCGGLAKADAAAA